MKERPGGVRGKKRVRGGREEGVMQGDLREIGRHANLLHGASADSMDGICGRPKKTSMNVNNWVRR